MAIDMGWIPAMCLEKKERPPSAGRHRPGLRRHRRRRLALLLVLVAQPLSQAARATDWRYCYAGSDADRRFYASQPFATSKPLEAIERQWFLWLGRQGIRFETTACPRGSDRTAIEDSMRSAARYNQGFGKRTVDLDWTPET
ncbi:hypothetical protein [uncultured Bosea sp.]|uniref:hypothetical protein n=1 Tax=uncultured Bosea sp. TaxID=211457 RepID=UPI0025F5C5F0|nr:hypothetical protein [uncultured Bosea sp.]